MFFESWEIIGPFKTWGFINLLLITLLIMHVYWSYLIIRMVLKAFHKGKVNHLPWIMMSLQSLVDYYLWG